MKDKDMNVCFNTCNRESQTCDFKFLQKVLEEVDDGIFCCSSITPLLTQLRCQDAHYVVSIRLKIKERKKVVTTQTGRDRHKKKAST